MNIVSIRGAITVATNTETDIFEASKILLEKIEEENKISKEDVISIVFTATKDLDQAYPARAARDLGYTYQALMCYNEMYVAGSLDKCIRIMLTCNSDRKQEDVKHIYLEGARILRPDLR